MNENEIALNGEQSGEEVDTTATNTIDAGENVSNEEQVAKSETPETELVKEFTKEDVRKMMQKRINRSHKSFFDRYGVENLEQLDQKFGLIEQLTNEKVELANQNTELLNKIAFIENDINPDRIEDVKAYFRGKEILFNNENLKTELATHPEWKNNSPTTTITEMSPLRSVKNEPNEEEEVAKMFGLERLIK